MAGHRDTPAKGVLWALVEALCEVPVLSEMRGRGLLLRIISDELNRPFSVDEHPQKIAHLYSIADGCRQTQDGLRALLKAVEHLEPEARSTLAVRRIVLQMTPLESWSPEEQQELFALLPGVNVPDAMQIYRFVGGAAAPQLHDNATVEEMILALDTLNAGADDLPRPLVFIEQLAARVGRVELGVKLRSWVERRARDMDLLSVLHAVRRLLPRTSIPTSPQPRSEAYLIFRFQPDGLGSRFRLTYWRQLDVTGGWCPEPGADVIGSVGELRQHVAAVIEGVEAEWARYVPDIRIEFVLPMTLLNLEVDQWPWEIQSPMPQPMGNRFSVVIRSLERMQRAAWHRQWFARWQELERQMYAHGMIAVESGYWSRSTDETGLRELVGIFERRDKLVALMPSAPPRSGAFAEINVALRAGIPVAVWHREDCADAEFVATVKGFLHEATTKHLLERVRMLRLDAYTESDHGPVGAHITVLWDDPKRMVGPDRPVPPEEVA